jgi:hypothetical protein
METPGSPSAEHQQRAGLKSDAHGELARMNASTSALESILD